MSDGSRFSDEAATDAFLTALSRGEDPSDGNDPFAADFAALVGEVSRDIPAAPRPVTSLDDRRRGWKGFLGAGLVGAAASALVIAGVGGAIFNSQPGDALWAANKSLFGNHAAVVELASTLQQADDARTRGDTDGALALLEQARVLAAALENTATHDGDVDKPETTETVTVTATPSEQPAAEPTTTETQPTVTVTETTTVTVAPEPTPTPTTVVAPTMATGTVAPAPTATPTHAPEIGTPPIIN